VHVCNSNSPSGSVRVDSIDRGRAVLVAESWLAVGAREFTTAARRRPLSVLALVDGDHPPIRERAISKWTRRLAGSVGVQASNASTYAAMQNTGRTHSMPCAGSEGVAGLAFSHAYTVRCFVVETKAFYY
jgi:hypothetical protein